MVPGGTTSICGEVFDVRSEILQILDSLEGHPYWYTRTAITLADGTVAQAYLMAKLSLNGREIVLSGNWRSRFIHLDYVKYRLADQNPYVLLDALHAVGPRAEFHTDDIVDQVSAQTGCHCIIATVSRTEADLNRELDTKNRGAVREYRQTIRRLLCAGGLIDGDNLVTARLLHLSFHGMQDRHHKDIELGSVFGESCSEDLFKWLSTRVRQWALDIKDARRIPIIVENQELFGEPVIARHRIGDWTTHYPGYGPNFNTVQIELAHWLRTEHLDSLIELFASIAQEFPLTS
jgi:hypothetical protein